MFQRNKVNYNLRNGDPLPRPRATVRSSGQDYEDRLAVEIMQRAKSARKRSLNVIQASGAFETERYVPLHHLKEPSNMQKQKLQETMSGIKEYPELDSLRVNRRDKHRRRPARQTGEQDPVEECESTKRFRREPLNINSTIINSNERNPRACRLAGRHGSIGRRPGSSHCHSEPDCRASAHRQAAGATATRATGAKRRNRFNGECFGRFTAIETTLCVFFFFLQANYIQSLVAGWVFIRFSYKMLAIFRSSRVSISSASSATTSTNRHLQICKCNIFHLVQVVPLYRSF